MIMRNDRFIASPVFQSALGPGPVLRPACIRFPQNDVRNARALRQTLQLPRHLIVKILRHIFRRRIHGLEGFEVVHELMVEPADDLANHMLELREVHQKPGRVELRPFKGHANAIIMTMHVLALASVAAQGMSCRKGLFYADLKHVSPKSRYTLAADLQLFRRDLPNGLPAARNRPSHQETGRHRPVPAWKRTRLNSSHEQYPYAVFCLKKKNSTG